MPFRRAVRTILSDFKKGAKQAKLDPRQKGMKVQVAGRLNGAEIARTEWVREGRVPLHTLQAKLDYATGRAHTIYGILGIKIWMCKG
ncbi:ribosomal protein S3 (chloroplast) [Nannochloropsis oceanica]|nr:ribosomal protein S3 [Nannochloropsis oceanica]AGI98887.1 ribosomal protein S3 [Nannochloropsis oceanica]AGI99386.1 ribosomal protein S3 [Nannochloropsis oceanica]